MVEVQAFLDYQAGAGGAALRTLDFFASCEEFLGEPNCVSSRVMRWWEANYPAAYAARLGAP
jgi:hypothetical protein